MPILRVSSLVGIAVIIGYFFLDPSMSSCGPGKSRTSEGADGIGAINRAQQAYHFEKQAFADSIEPTNANDLGIILHSDYFSFSTQATDNAAFSYAIPKEKDPYLESYVGAIFY